MPPVISIITPTYNAMPYLRDCVQSVMEQNHQDWEMLIGNNASTDETAKYLESLADPRIRIFNHENNLGIYGNLNFLFSQASAPVAQILCADDYLLPDGLGNIVGAWTEAAADVGLIRFKAPSDDTDTLRMSVCKLPIAPADGPFYFFLFGNLCGNLSNVSLRTQLVNDLGHFRVDLPFAGDFEFCARLAQKHVVIISSKTVNHVRCHEGSATNYLNRKGELAKELFSVVEVLLQPLRGRYPDFLLRLHVAMTCDLQHLHAGLRLLVVRRTSIYLKNLREARESSSISFPEPIIWLLYLLSGASKCFTTLPAKLLLKQHQTNCYDIAKAN